MLRETIRNNDYSRNFRQYSGNTVTFLVFLARNIALSKPIDEKIIEIICSKLFSWKEQYTSISGVLQWGRRESCTDESPWRYKRKIPLKF